MNAYITKANAKRIIYNLDVSNFHLEDEIFLIEFRWFSQYESRNLLAFKQLYKDPDEFFKVYKRRKPTDKKQYVYEGALPSYHKSVECERLLSSFQNYELPDEIKEQGDEAIEKFRDWFKENSHLMEDKMDLFLDRLKYKFGLKERPKAVDYRNSGIDVFENHDLEDLEEKITLKIRETDQFYESSLKVKTILNAFGKISFIHKKRDEPRKNNTGYTNEEIWEVLKAFELKYKDPIAELLKEYYKVKYNPELEFQGLLLEQLGFTPCRLCHEEEFLDEFERRSDAKEFNSSDRDGGLPF